MNERLEDIIGFRKQKLENIIAAGMEAYPSTTNRTNIVADVIEKFDVLQEQSLTLVGRIRSLRVMGKLAFFHIEDGSGRIQNLLRADDIGQDQFDFFCANFDIGDFVESTGQLMKTKTGEITLALQNFRMLAKSLRPLPSEHYGLEDEEQKLRKRYLDILLDPEVKQLFVKKNRFWQAMRSYLVEHDFLEMEMPVLEATPGGAEAEPFITHHNALGRDFYLRISLELPLKKMLVAGYERVFEIGRIFRNEGISPTHLQDYTQMEFYWAYGDFEGMMKFVQGMYQHIIEQTFGTLQITVDEITVDWSGDWERVDYLEIFKKYTQLDLAIADDADLKKYLDSQNVKYESYAQRGRLIDLAFKKVRATIPTGKPVFLVNQPIELEPLAKRDPSNPAVVQRMQIIAYGTELGKGFGELNDPLDQRRRFEDQAKLREAGDNEAQMMDEDYLEAMEYGMPPAAGFGVSERLFSVLAGRSIRETVVFPPMRQVGSGNAKSKNTKIAVAVINEQAALVSWQQLNTVAHLAAAFAARNGKQLILQDEIMSADDQAIKLNIQHAIMIKTAQEGRELKELIKLAQRQGLEVAEFTREMLETTNDKKVISQTAEKHHSDIEHLGILIFGDKDKVEQLTAKFPLYS